MKREPSIHISRSLLKNLLGSQGFTLEDEDLDFIMSQARRYSLDHRLHNVANKRSVSNVNRRVVATIKDAQTVADTIYACRVKLRHLGVTKIKQSDNQWVAVKELVPTINQFCEMYELESREGCIEFISIGLDLMSKGKRVNYNFCANWLNDHAEWVVREYQAKRDIEEDHSAEYTRELYSYYTREILDRTGISNTYDKNPTEYVEFIRARELADSMGIDYDTFIQAQFHALEFCNGIPQIQDLSGDKARERVLKYMAKFNIVARPKTQHIDWNEFKK